MSVDMLLLSTAVPHQRHNLPASWHDVLQDDVLCGNQIDFHGLFAIKNQTDIAPVIISASWNKYPLPWMPWPRRLHDESMCSIVVCFYWRYWLWVAHFFQHDSEWNCLFLIIKQGSQISFGFWVHKILDDQLKSKDGSIFELLIIFFVR